MSEITLILDAAQRGEQFKQMRDECYTSTYINDATIFVSACGVNEFK